MKKPISIIIVEDHFDYRDTLELLLGNMPEFEIAGSFNSAEQALRELESNQSQPDPEIILLDLNLPGMSGIEFIPWCQKYSPKSKILVLSQSNRESDVLRAIQKGADGYLLKSSTMHVIAEGLKAVSSGGAILDPNLASFILNELKAKAPQITVSGADITKRELDVLTLIADGHSQKEIGDQLAITKYTVTDHLKSIYAKLGVKNAPQAVAVAYRHGLFKEDGDRDG
ncbi:MULTISPECIES: response regulator transcription factor [unclassified Lentimonas]|uniref:response regulator n=1 Tax=unclassified Lentimonas TaxID=2630993 RepID=UPI0013264415|nr:MULTISPECIES: response regulator transcription factor [unclassified Lentimonas]CAA6676259.1 Unannotated [Lentimonas sp. CC4]CAA6683854.1 Unannotated [Lentimonas sp. CC6]CAA6692738.1 Unannotated [Lentimonas sp. CC10]CAA6696696.1 Unannotated [Lentimonas sp. CC19]CAA7072324.1 Unannotated [Lentimonas sp. CC11]